jgi:hypothetical protein
VAASPLMRRRRGSVGVGVTGSAAREHVTAASCQARRQRRRALPWRALRETLHPGEKSGGRRWQRAGARRRQRPAAMPRHPYTNVSYTTHYTAIRPHVHAQVCLCMYPIISGRASGEISTVWGDSSPSLSQPLGGEGSRGDAGRWQWRVGIAAGNVRRAACVAEMERARWSAGVIRQRHVQIDSR